MVSQRAAGFPLLPVHRVLAGSFHCVECCEDGHEAPSAAELSHKQVGVARAQPLHRQASTGSAQPAAP